MMRQDGFSLLALLFLVAGLGVALAAVGTVWETASRRDREQELLFVGNQYRQALASYQRATPAGQPAHPRALEELLLDPRFPHTVRHLRRPYPDPITGTGEWGLVRVEGGIQGVHSLSTAHPLKMHGFSGEDAAFEGLEHYADWVFGARPPTTGPQRSPSSEPPEDIGSEP